MFRPMVMIRRERNNEPVGYVSIPAEELTAAMLANETVKLFRHDPLYRIIRIHDDHGVTTVWVKRVRADTGNELLRSYTVRMGSLTLGTIDLTPAQVEAFIADSEPRYLLASEPRLRVTGTRVTDSGEHRLYVAPASLPLMVLGGQLTPAN